MKEKVELLELAVDIASTEEAAAATIKYITGQESKVVYFLNSETLLLLQEQPQWKQAVEESGMILPGTANVNKSVNDVLGHTRASFFFESYLDRILDYAVEQGYECLLVTETEAQLASVQENMHEQRPYLSLLGVCVSPEEETLEYLVNEINSAAPDILLLALTERHQLELLERYRTQMNAGLLLFTGNLLFNKAVAEAEVPVRIRKLRIDNVYKWFQKKGRIRGFFNNLRMKLRLRQEQKEKDE